MDQKLALEILHSGASVLLTGEAGSGKTYLLNQFITDVRKQGKKVAVTATTGLAATHLGGSTIHRWSRMGILDHLTPKFFKKLTKNDRKRMLEVDVLIIDEISMLNDYQFDILNQILKTVRSDLRPFGGVQVVLSGDFFQLPPIRSERKADSQLDIFASGLPSLGFVTESAAYQELAPKVCYLLGQFRQQDDSLSQILTSLRAGIFEDYELQQLQRRLFKEEQLPASKQSRVNLHTNNVDVERINARALAQIKAAPYSYQMQGQGGRYGLESLARSVLAPQVLELKLDASVMAVKNDPKNRYVNGSLGRVVDFYQQGGVWLPIVEFNSGRRVKIAPESWELRENETLIAKVSQLPLRLAYAITVHKAQGMTLDSACINLAKAFTPGMGYVALSRVRSLDELFLTGLNQMALTVADQARQLDVDLKRASKIEAQNWAKSTKN